LFNPWLGKSIRIFLIMLLSTVAFGQTTSALVSSPATPEEYLHSLIGQKLLMLQFGDADHSKIKKSDLDKVKISCDSAVQIQGVRDKEREVTFDWLLIGIPEIGKNVPRNCRNKSAHLNGTLTITHLASDETAASLAESVSKVLQTPEQYLATELLSFRAPLELNSIEGTLEGVAPVVPLLIVNGTFSDLARKRKYHGIVKVRFTIGTDGRVHQPEIINSGGMGLDEQVLTVLPLWRYQPANKNGKSVAVTVEVKMSFSFP
jgi:TonB family protein